MCRFPWHRRWHAGLLSSGEQGHALSKKSVQLLCGITLRGTVERRLEPAGLLGGWGLSGMMSFNGLQENTTIRELTEVMTHFIASGSGLYMVGGRGREKKVGAEVCRLGG